MISPSSNGPQIFQERFIRNPFALLIIVLPFFLVTVITMYILINSDDYDLYYCCEMLVLVKQKSDPQKSGSSSTSGSGPTPLRLRFRQLGGRIVGRIVVGKRWLGLVVVVVEKIG
ncbi:hypothetical protein Tco_0729665 [Tanacetum coccineum]|uniref:Transmembrane protein n=1 Tax=Tanacetum coccineum TaxID=301880 RepID=A0ABQ4YPH4_9ASTR